MKRRDDSIASHAPYARSYDEKAREYGCFGGEILFGLCYEYISPGSRLLDIGIGTGLSSLPFAKAGLEIYGIDGSAEMLQACAEKHIAQELREHNLNDLPLPYPESSFQDVISCGVFHFFGDLTPLFKDISRIIKPGGVFSFTIMRRYMNGNTGSGKTDADYRPETSQEGVEIFVHGKRYIGELLRLCGFKECKEQLFVAQDDSMFSAHVVKKALALDVSENKR